MRILGSLEFLLYYTYPTPGKKIRRKKRHPHHSTSHQSHIAFLSPSNVARSRLSKPRQYYTQTSSQRGRELTRTIRTQVEALRLELEALAETVIADWTARAGFEGSLLETGICRDVSTYFRFWLGFFLYSQRTEFPEGLHVSWEDHLMRGGDKTLTAVHTLLQRIRQAKRERG